MDCLAAQEIVSAAFDRQPVNAGALSAAEEHCRSCAECRRLVSVLEALAELPVPEPPEGFEERVIRAVRQEQRVPRTGVPQTGEAAAHVAPGADADHASPTRTSPGVSALIQQLLTGSSRRALAFWASAAAAVLIAAGFLALWGARQILAPPPTRTFLATEGSTGAQSEPEAVPQTPMPGSEATAPEQGGPSASTLLLAQATLIVVDGTVYRSAGRDDSVDKSALAPAGTVRTALREGGLVTDRTVLTGSDPARVFLEDDDGSLIAFERVTMSYQGRTYVLQSEPIERFGALATLPRRFTRPVAPDGSPTFERATGEAGPQEVYVAKGRDASFGIALPPGARPDVAEGWSWWAPASP